MWQLLGLLMSHMPQTTWTWTLQQVFDGCKGGRIGWVGCVGGDFCLLKVANPKRQRKINKSQHKTFGQTTATTERKKSKKNSRREKKNTQKIPTKKCKAKSQRSLQLFGWQQKLAKAAKKGSSSSWGREGWL